MTTRRPGGTTPPSRDWARELRDQRAKIRYLQAELKLMRDEQDKLLDAVDDCQQQTLWIKEKLDRIETFLLDAPKEVSGRVRTHRARGRSV